MGQIDQIKQAQFEMPVLAKIAKRFKKSKPFKGLTISACMHITKETGVLLHALAQGGAKIYLAASNPMSTQYSVAWWLRRNGVKVCFRNYERDINWIASKCPHIIIDDGGDLTREMMNAFPTWRKNLIGGMEETTTGMIRLRALERDGILRFPVVAINDTPTKRLFDNVYGTGQSTMEAIIQETNMLFAGKVVVVAGYGHCGTGVTARARGLGARVIVTEIDARKALQAHMNGYDVMTMAKAAKIGDVFVTVTGNVNVITADHFKIMKDGAVLANAGHFDVEIAVKEVPRRLQLLAEGRLVNLVSGRGHPPAVMDMSFSNQALCAEWIVINRHKIKPGIHAVPQHIDDYVATEKLKALGLKIDMLTEEQKQYLNK